MQKQDALTRLKLNRDLPVFGDLIRDSVREIEDVQEERDRVKLALRAVIEALIRQLILEECKDKNLPFTIFESKRDRTPKSIRRPKRPSRAKQLRLMKEKARIAAADARHYQRRPRGRIASGLPGHSRGSPSRLTVNRVGAER